LKELGVKISLDDFGTGYSSLSYLHRFPIDTLKIDRSFVARMQADKADKNAEIIRTILSLATTLGMEVIAEGVETQEQIYTLSGLRCNYVQGYWLSKPLNGEAMTQLISETYVSGIGADL
jgi:EAL domain-containing protein (putative c-di-GMP-specific phosphodiesterase class I)